MTQAVLPQFRERGSGVVVNVTSTVTMKPLHLLSVYTASKAAVNAFSESLALELEQFGIRIRLVLPGLAPDTAFAQNAMGRSRVLGVPQPYAALTESVFAAFQQPGEVTHAIDVAEAVWRAATDAASPFRILAGADAVALAAAA